MKNATISTIDEAGRIVVPKSLREEAGLVPGAPLALSVRDGTVLIEPAPRAVRAVRRGKLTVAVPEDESVPLTEDVVRRTRNAIRSRRAT